MRVWSLSTYIFLSKQIRACFKYPDKITGKARRKRMPYCPKCGSNVDETMTFCPKCGTTLKDTTPSPAAPESKEQEKQEKPEKPANAETQDKNQYGFVYFLIGGLIL